MKFPITQYGLNFRLVVEDDAEFIVALRTHEKLARYISYTDNSVENQINWIKNYKHRETKGEEYYILFEDENHVKLGVVRIYNIKDDSFTAGSWLIGLEADELAGLKSDLFILAFSFDELKLKKCYIDIRKDNKKLVRYHNMFFKQINEDEYNIYLVMDIEGYKKKTKYLTSILNL